MKPQIANNSNRETDRDKELEFYKKDRGQNREYIHRRCDELQLRKQVKGIGWRGGKKSGNRK